MTRENGSQLRVKSRLRSKPLCMLPDTSGISAISPKLRRNDPAQDIDTPAEECPRSIIFAAVSIHKYFKRLPIDELHKRRLVRGNARWVPRFLLDRTYSAVWPNRRDSDMAHSHRARSA